MARLRALRLTDFRSYTALDIDLARGPVVLFGQNGAGKTNLLEAISLLSPGRGLRRAGIEHLVRSTGDMRAPAWGINAELEDGFRLSVGQVPEQPRRKALRIDGKAATGAQLAEAVSMMWLSPAQDRLFTGPAGDRRKFLDRFAMAHSPAHGVASLRFEKVRAQRNRLLSDGIEDAGWYEALEADLAARAADIASARVDVIAQLQTAIAGREDSVFPTALIGLEGLLEDALMAGASKTDAQEDYREQLAETRRIDMRAGRTLLGPHRTELHVTHAAKAMPAALCSTGEQKALLIGLVLAQARALIAREPILLLDEVAAHLDDTRRAALAQELIDLDLQVFMTGTDAALFTDFGAQAQIFEVLGGELILQ